MGTTTKFAIPYPELTDPPDGAGQMKALAQKVDTALGGSGFACTSTTRPTPTPGAMIFETDTGRIMVGVTVATINYWAPLPGTHVFGVRQTTQQTGISTDGSVATPINFQAVDHDPFNWWVAGSPTQFKPKIPGRYEMTGGVGTSNNATGFRSALWVKNGNGALIPGTASTAAAVNGGGNGVPARTTIIPMNGTTDYIELRIIPYQGASTTSVTPDYQCTMAATYAGP